MEQRVTHHDLASYCLQAYSAEGPEGFTLLGGNPGPKAWAKLHPKDGSATVIFTGTDDIADALADVTAWLVPGESLYRGKVHAGFRAWWWGVSRAVRAFVGHRPVYIAGHSLGGAMALAAAYDFHKTRSQTPVVECVTFGGPRYGDREWCEHFREMSHHSRTTRYVYALDPTPHVPPRAWGYDDVCPATWIGDAMQSLIGMWRGLKRTIRALLSVHRWSDLRRAILESALVAELYGNHFMETYISWSPGRTSDL